MLLAYVDEGGTNYQQKNGFFVDGPFAIWSAVLIPESKYFHLERLFYSIANEILGIRDWKKEELHGNVLWNSRTQGVDREKKVRTFFNEVLQLAAKLDIVTVYGIHPKGTAALSADEKKKELRIAQNCMLHALEHRLAQLGETAILIADAADEDDTLAELLYERTCWRYNPGDSLVPQVAPKYKFEYQSCFLLDQIHRVDSRTSLFVQFADQINFVLQRVHAFSFLETYKKKGRPTPDITKVPIITDSFDMYREKLFVGYWNEDDHCVNHVEALNSSGAGAFLTRSYMDQIR